MLPTAPNASSTAPSAGPDVASADPTLARPLVTVILPTHNRSGLVGRSARSVLGQVYQNLELLIIDDASTDDTPGVLARLAAEDARIRVLRNAVNTHAPGARNVALREARGEYVAFIDDDDEWLPLKLEYQMRIAHRFAVVGCHRSVDRRPERIETEPEASVPFTRKSMEAFFWNKNGYQPSTMLSRTEYVRAIGGFDASMPGPEGIDLFIHLVDRFGGAACIERRLIVYYTHQTHRKARITTGRGLAGAARLELEKNGRFRSPDALRFRNCDIELLALAHCPDLPGKLRHFWRALTFVQPSRARTYARLFFGKVFSRWPGVRQALALYRAGKYR